MDDQYYRMHSIEGGAFEVKKCKVRTLLDLKQAIKRLTNISVPRQKIVINNNRILTERNAYFLSWLGLKDRDSILILTRSYQEKLQYDDQLRNQQMAQEKKPKGRPTSQKIQQTYEDQNRYKGIMKVPELNALLSELLLEGYDQYKCELAIQEARGDKQQTIRLLDSGFAQQKIKEINCAELMYLWALFTVPNYPERAKDLRKNPKKIEGVMRGAEKGNKYVMPLLVKHREWIIGYLTDSDQKAMHFFPPKSEQDQQLYAVQLQNSQDETVVLKYKEMGFKEQVIIRTLRLNSNTTNQNEIIDRLGEGEEIKQVDVDIPEGLVDYEMEQLFLRKVLEERLPQLLREGRWEEKKYRQSMLRLLYVCPKLYKMVIKHQEFMDWLIVGRPLIRGVSAISRPNQSQQEDLQKKEIERIQQEMERQRQEMESKRKPVKVEQQGRRSKWLQLLPEWEILRCFFQHYRFREVRRQLMWNRELTVNFIQQLKSVGSWQFGKECFIYQMLDEHKDRIIYHLSGVFENQQRFIGMEAIRKYHQANQEGFAFERELNAQQKAQYHRSLLQGLRTKEVEERVKQKVGLGYHRDLVESCLVAGEFNPLVMERYLLGGVPVFPFDLPRDWQMVQTQLKHLLQKAGTVSYFDSDRQQCTSYTTVSLFEARPKSFRLFLLSLEETNPFLFDDLLRNRVLVENLLKNLRRNGDGKVRNIMDEKGQSILSSPINQKDHTNIDQLAGMGFSDRFSAASYFLCNRNVESAADMLFQNQQGQNRAQESKAK